MGGGSSFSAASLGKKCPARVPPLQGRLAKASPRRGPKNSAPLVLLNSKYTPLHAHTTSTTQFCSLAKSLFASAAHHPRGPSKLSSSPTSIPLSPRPQSVLSGPKQPSASLLQPLPARALGVAAGRLCRLSPPREPEPYSKPYRCGRTGSLLDLAARARPPLAHPRSEGDGHEQRRRQEGRGGARAQVRGPQGLEAGADCGEARPPLRADGGGR